MQVRPDSFCGNERVSASVCITKDATLLPKRNSPSRNINTTTAFEQSISYLSANYILDLSRKYKRITKQYEGFTRRRKKYLNSLYFHYPCFELLIGQGGLALDARFVVVYGVDRIVEDLRNFFSVMYSHTDQCKDPQLGIQ